jgi:eukaryotic-like serine/threonine-protein kinase
VTELARGCVVAGYRLDRVLGRGGMGEVWAARPTGAGPSVALKVLKSELRARPRMKRRLLREARAAAAINHPNVVRVHDVVDAGDDTPVIVMDLLEGETLARRLSRSEALHLEEAATILLPVFDAVLAAHRCGIVHRDLKPDNIFLANDGAAVSVKVLDFGSAKLTRVNGEPNDSGLSTETGSMLGTPCYMAPEQGFGEKDVDHRADVWALGAISYECLAGGRPVEAENLGQFLKQLLRDGITPLDRVTPGLPAEVTRLVSRMLELDRGKRLSDLAEAAGVLARYAPSLTAHASQRSRSIPSIASIRRWSRGHRLIGARILAAVALTGAVGVASGTVHEVVLPAAPATAVPEPPPETPPPRGAAAIRSETSPAVAPVTGLSLDVLARGRVRPGTDGPATKRPGARRPRTKQVELGNNEAPILD